MNKTDEELLEQAQKLQIEAQTLVFQSGLFAIIQQFGPAFLHGSVELNLLVHRDIDIDVQIPRDQDAVTFFGIGAAITQQFQVLKASYSNHFIRNYPGFDHGLYWGIQVNHQGQKWKLDLWGHGPRYFEEHCAQFKLLQQTLNNLDRVTILRIKDTLHNEDGYQDGVSSNDIYTAITVANVRTVEQFHDWRIYIAK